MNNGERERLEACRSIIRAIDARKKPLNQEQQETKERLMSKIYKDRNGV